LEFFYIEAKIKIWKIEFMDIFEKLEVQKFPQVFHSDSKYSCNSISVALYLEML